jgi:exosortase D (VPLPA-CTERM-specific)
MSNSAEAVPLFSTREDGLSSGLPRWQVAAILLLIAWLYTPILIRLVLQWVGPAHDPNFQHGIFVPIFAAFVIWQDRERLRAIPSSPSWAGLVLVAFSMITLILGQWGAENFLSRVSLLILLAGLIILFQGWTFFRAVLFPWAFLILMIPIPNLIIQQVNFPLQLVASRLATNLLQLVGVPVFREGNLIQLAAMPLDVAEACSGIRSLLSLVTLSIIYGYLLESRMWVRVVLTVLAVPIAVVANSFRIFGTGLLVQAGHPDAAEGFYHALSGVLIFAVALTLLFAVHWLITLIWKSKPLPAKPIAKVVKFASNETPIRAGGSRFAAVALLLFASAVGLQAHSHNEVFPPREPLSSLPKQMDTWTGTDEALDQQTLEILGPGEYLLRDYENAKDLQPAINLYIAYFPTQKTGDTIHSPNHCLPGAGWIPVRNEVVHITRPDGSSFPANRYVGSKGGERQLALYWFQAHGRVVASDWKAKFYLVEDSIRMDRSDGSLVRLMTPMLEGESADAAQARVMQLGSRVLPLLDDYIPR